MKLSFYFDWSQNRKPEKVFKHSEAFSLFSEYHRRILKYVPCVFFQGKLEPKPGRKIWICERKHAKRPVSSEELAAQWRQTLSQGIKELVIVIGGPNGISEERRRFWKPLFLWSFGPLTLPHELAAVVAAEQIYRACTIYAGEPYHLKH